MTCVNTPEARMEQQQGRLSAVAEKIAAGLIDDQATPAYLKDPAYSEAVRLYAFAQARVQFLREVIDGEDLTGLTAAGSVVREAWNLLERAEDSLADRVARLGQDPVSRAQLGRMFAASVDLADLWKDDEPEGEEPE